jgi:antitoxin component HigA of HigAB toxin-antitoxin module
MSAEVMKITTEEQYEKAVEKIETLWDAPPGTPEFLALEQLVALIYEYEGNGPELTDE